MRLKEYDTTASYRQGLQTMHGTRAGFWHAGKTRAGLGCCVTDSTIYKASTYFRIEIIRNVIVI